jgi:hypothetical protein
MGVLSTRAAPSFRPEQTDSFLPRSLPANASVCVVEESLFDRARDPLPLHTVSLFLVP